LIGNITRSGRAVKYTIALRAARLPLTAAALADRLEVTVRTIYRDIAALQASRVPIEGAPGLGYVLRRGFDLPPLMFTADEIDAIAVGARQVRRLRDPKLQQATESVLAKVTAVVPEDWQAYLRAAPFYVSEGSAPPPAGVDLAAVREAIRARRKMAIAYVDGEGQQTERTVWPIAMAYYVDVTVVAAWCEMRRAFRHFRADRILNSALLEERFSTGNGRLLAEWLALGKDRPDTPH
jgi:predicted DNA-binding transcriptional regulator YafY